MTMNTNHDRQVLDAGQCEMNKSNCEKGGRSLCQRPNTKVSTPLSVDGEPPSVKAIDDNPRGMEYYANERKIGKGKTMVAGLLTSPLRPGMLLRRPLVSKETLTSKVSRSVAARNIVQMHLHVPDPTMSFKLT